MLTINRNEEKQLQMNFVRPVADIDRRWIKQHQRHYNWVN